jgi:hypothetical protein
MMRGIAWRFAPALLLVLIAACPSRASLILTFDAAKVQASTVPGVTTETFDTFGTGPLPGGTITPVGTFSSGGTIMAADQFGGARGVGNFLSVVGTNQLTLTLPGPQAYFGFWWSAADPGNIAEFLSGGKLLASFDAANTLGALDSTYDGNPNPPPGRNLSEKYVYLNLVGTGGTTFDQIVFTNNLSTTNFELDNFSISATTPDPIPGTPVDGLEVPIPEPSSLVVFGLAAACGLAYRRWRGLSRRACSLSP